MAAADFEKQSYWHDRFTQESAFDWLVPSSTFLAVLEPYIVDLSLSSTVVLNVGSGTSSLHVTLRARGFSHVTNLDYEPLAAERGLALEKAAFGDSDGKGYGGACMSYVVADVTRLAGEEHATSHHGRYRLVVDKSTADAVACGGPRALLAMAEGILACLAEGGVWFSLSYSRSRFDVPGLPFDVSVVAKIPTPKERPVDPDIFHWCYALRPRGNP